jgi:hypothetical protein
MLLGGAFVLAAPSASADAGAAFCQMGYGGGPVVSGVQVVLVQWGAGVDPGAQALLPATYRTLFATPYLDWLSEYYTTGRVDGGQSIGRGTFVGAFTVTPTFDGGGPAGLGATPDTDIASELVAQIQAGTLPMPAVDSAGNARTFYVVQMPPGQDVVLDDRGQEHACIDFCSFHSTIDVGGLSVPYGIVPDMAGPCIGACGATTYTDQLTLTHTLVTLAAITDPQEGLGWTNNIANSPCGGEVPSGCKRLGAAGAARVCGLLVADGWSNVQNACTAGIDGAADAGCIEEFDAGASPSDAAPPPSGDAGGSSSDAAADAGAGASGGPASTTTASCSCRIAAPGGVSPIAAFAGGAAAVAAACLRRARRRHRPRRHDDQ